MKVFFNYTKKISIALLLSVNVYAAEEAIVPTEDSPVSASVTEKSKPKKLSKLDNYLLDAKFSYHRGDYFRAIKLLELARSKDESSFFDSKYFSIYVKALASLENTKQLKSVCRKAESQISIYQCAHTYYQIGLHRESLRTLKKSETGQEREALLLAANFLALKNADKCIESLAKSKFTVDFMDLKSLSYARCHVLKRDYGTAISYYKNVSSDSRHYMDALYEMAWAQFKERNIGDTKATIDVLLSSYSEFSEDRSEISQHEYFSLRYLRAYLGLVQSGASNVEEDLSLALQDIENIKKKVNISDDAALKVLASLNDSSKTWTDLINEGGDFKVFVDFFGNWGSGYKNRSLVQSMKFHLALSIEKKNAEKYNNAGYLKSISELHAAHKESLEKSFIASFRTTLQALNGFELRIKLAKQKKNVLAETEGLRNLEQAKEIYHNKVNYINQLVGGIE